MHYIIIPVTLCYNLLHADEDAENWCQDRSQDTPSSLAAVQPSDSTFNFDQGDSDNDDSGFGILQPLSAVTLFLIVMIIKLMFN